MISARTKAALQAAKARGVRLGRNAERLAPANRTAALDHANQIKDVLAELAGSGSGDMMFFGLALALRRTGMNLPEIEMTLRGEAQFGRSPKERRAQIPSIMNSLRRYFGPVSGR
jgi:hypothetical protein